MKKILIRLIPTWLLRKIVNFGFNAGYVEMKRRNGFEINIEYDYDMGPKNGK